MALHLHILPADTSALATPPSFLQSARLRSLWWPVYPSSLLPSHLGVSKTKTTKPIRLERWGNVYTLFRGANNQPVIVPAACPHRGADLSAGFVVDGDLVCPYHGFRFGSADNSMPHTHMPCTSIPCKSIPCQDPSLPIPESLHLRRMPVREEHGWIWMSFAPEKHALTQSTQSTQSTTSLESTVMPWVPEAAPPHADDQYAEIVWDIPFDRTMEGMLDIHHFPFTHQRYSPNTPRLDPYHAELDAAGILRTCGTLRQVKTPQKNAGYTFRIDVAFPSIIHLDFSAWLRGVAVCCPRDAQSTWIGIRYQANLPYIGRIPWIGSWLRRATAWFALWSELRLIQPDDYRMLQTHHQPPDSPHLLHGDRGIALWRSWYQRAQQV